MIQIGSLLKENTNDLHTRLEQIGFIDKILNRSLTKEEYKKLILSNYIFHLSMEEKLQGITGIHQLNIKWKMPFLEKDKIEVGGFEFKKLEIDFEIKDITEALGCLYVLEGATLGGRVIKKHLEHLSIPMHYYGCYGEEGGMHWKKFMQNLATFVDTNEKAERSLSAAKKTFEFCIECFEKVISKSN